MESYPKWYEDAIEEYEDALVDGLITHKEFNQAMRDLDEELYNSNKGPNASYDDWHEASI